MLGEVRECSGIFGEVGRGVKDWIGNVRSTKVGGEFVRMGGDW
jgi:hypothetical protein